MANQTKIERKGRYCEVVVHQMRADGKSYPKIADHLEEYFDMSISKDAVKNYLKNYSDKHLAQIGENNVKELRKNEVERILDVGNQLESINEKLNNALDSLDETDRQDMGFLVNLSKELRQHMKFHKEYMEQVTNPDKVEGDVTINKTQQVLQVNERLEELEEKGIIEIKKPDKLSPV